MFKWSFVTDMRFHQKAPFHSTPHSHFWQPIHELTPWSLVWLLCFLLFSSGMGFLGCHSSKARTCIPNLSVINAPSDSGPEDCILFEMIQEPFPETPQLLLNNYFTEFGQELPFFPVYFSMIFKKFNPVQKSTL